MTASRIDNVNGGDYTWPWQGNVKRPAGSSWRGLKPAPKFNPGGWSAPVAPDRSVVK